MFDFPIQEKRSKRLQASLQSVVLAAFGVMAVAAPIASTNAAPTAPPGPLTIAVYGDSPYGRTAYSPGGQTSDVVQYQLSPDFIETINNDPSVSEVFHVGDIHSGKDFCTEDYDDNIASLWPNFQKPLVYTPGDNEWTDCHKATSATAPGEGGGFYSSGVLKYIGTSGVTRFVTVRRLQLRQPARQPRSRSTAVLRDPGPNAR